MPKHFHTALRNPAALAPALRAEYAEAFLAAALLADEAGDAHLSAVYLRHAERCES